MLPSTYVLCFFWATVYKRRVSLMWNSLIYAPYNFHNEIDDIALTLTFICIMYQGDARCPKVHDGFRRKNRASWFESGGPSTSWFHFHWGLFSSKVCFNEVNLCAFFFFHFKFLMHELASITLARTQITSLRTAYRKIFMPVLEDVRGFEERLAEVVWCPETREFSLLLLLWKCLLVECKSILSGAGWRAGKCSCSMLHAAVYSWFVWRKQTRNLQI